MIVESCDSSCIFSVACDTSYQADGQYHEAIETELPYNDYLNSLVPDVFF